MSIYHDEKVVVAIREVIQGYYIKLNSRNDWTLEDIRIMLEDDLKTLRIWDGDDMLAKVIKTNNLK